MDFNFDDLMSGAADMMQGDIPDPFQDPPAAEPAWQGRAFGEEPVLQDAPPQSPPVDVAPMPMDQGMAFGSNPYSVPDLRNDPAGRLMENAIAQAGRDIGGSYFESGGTEMGGGRSQLDPSRVINYGMTGIDTSGDVPTLRVYNFGDRDGGDPTQLVAKPIRDFNDFRSIPSPWSPLRDDAGDYVLDENGRRQYRDLPGVDFRGRFGAGLTPTALENGQQVYYDPANNMTYGARDGQPGALLAGGMGLDGATRQQANYYGWIPTTDARGNPVYYDEASNRTFMRNRDGSAGRQILDVNRDARFLDGGRVGGGQGGVPVRRTTVPATTTTTTTNPSDFEYPDMSGLAGPDERLAAGLGSGGLGPERSPEPPSTPVQRVSQEIPVTNPNEQNALRIPPGSVKQKFDTGEGTPAIYRYTTPDGTVIITDAQGNVLQRNR